jgi:hypothetical protein
MPKILIFSYILYLELVVTAQQLDSVSQSRTFNSCVPGLRSKNAQTLHSKLPSAKFLLQNPFKNEDFNYQLGHVRAVHISLG